MAARTSEARPTSMRVFGFDEVQHRFDGPGRPLLQAQRGMGESFLAELA